MPQPKPEMIAKITHSCGHAGTVVITSRTPRAAERAAQRPCKDCKPKRGGARPGAGRKPLSPEEQRRWISVSLEPNVMLSLKARAESEGVTPHRYVAEAVWRALVADDPVRKALAARKLKKQG